MNKNKVVDDFIGTIDSDEEIDEIEELEEPEQPKLSKKEQIQRRKNKEVIQDKPVSSKGKEIELEFDFENINNHLNLAKSDELQSINSSSIDNIIKKKLNTLDDTLKEKRKSVLDKSMSSYSYHSPLTTSDDIDDEEEDVNDDDTGSENDENIIDDDDDDPLASSDEENVEEDDEDDEDVEQDQKEENSDEDDSEEDEDEERKKNEFFAQQPTASTNKKNTFTSLGLSRPILKAISGLGFTHPTPIQKTVMPVALAGKDVVGQAVTGSGKTAAFILPVLERLMYRPKTSSKGGETRVLVLCPTRELAQQCFEVGQSLSKFMGDISFCLCVGGLSLKLQEQQLKQRPDVVIATPGRLIDHVRNSPSFTLDALDILIMDEADRMLEDGFKDELDEIVKECPKNRQTMLFSATMTDKVDELVRLSLNKPVRLFVDPKKSTAKGLTQEFVRIRSNSKNDLKERTATLLSLCRRTFKQRTIIFFRSKALAHRMRIMFGLMELNAEELHGDLSQEQRLNALERFKNQKSDYLLATDLASRGLDIKGVETVINFDLPNQIEIYLHRVGRTARAGTSGRSVSLIGETDRKMLKNIVKRSSAQSTDSIKHRIVPTDVLSDVAELVESLQDQIDEILKEEKEDRAIRVAEMELQKSKNMIEHEDEIKSRPARTWFQSEKEKKDSKEAGKEQYNANFDKGDADKTKKTHDSLGRKLNAFSGLSRKDRRKKEMKEELEADKNKSKGIDYAVRSAKKAVKPQRMSVLADSSAKSSQAKSQPSKKRKSTGFEEDKSVKAPKKSKEGERVKPGAAIGRSNKKPRAKGKGKK
ncbi:DEAD-domain-containing protein [Wallemia mellicola]|nr:DEAD-domain-containing protein [Wallemia mellicola]TIB89657.1 DEAD-domain-containing protein [Wallemia mellicola]TIC41513.1 DEAD-domain-containing protein [Wallemia mellicola]TIC50207.1 DEAD-domain-containing protein [Wallemia mellicola]TIC55461.1 DEAD-domain-containing protein [Wallemia mellicola]